MKSCYVMVILLMLLINLMDAKDNVKNVLKPRKNLEMLSFTEPVKMKPKRFRSKYPKKAFKLDNPEGKLIRTPRSVKRYLDMYETDLKAMPLYRSRNRVSDMFE